MESFLELELNPALKDNLKRHGFKTPTPVQAQAIPPALAGQNVVATAQTGTGKTLAFALPMVQKLIEKTAAGNPAGGASAKKIAIQAVILSPTRELAIQIEETFFKIVAGTPIRSAVVVGGMSESTQLRNISRGVHVLIATPGRLCDFLRRRLVNLTQVKVMVLDEADRMLDMGFQPDLDAILEHLPEQRQTMLFSATMDQSVAHLVREYAPEHVRVSIGETTRTADQVELHHYEIGSDKKLDLLAHLLRQDDGAFLVFARTKHGTDRLAKNLAMAGFKAARIHGDRTQGQRNQALRGFKNGDYRVLVATDVAARGIHVDGISHVVNFDLPMQPEDFIHRVGRTGRAGAKGVASTFSVRNERNDVRRMERALKLKLVPMAVPERLEAAELDPTLLDENFSAPVRVEPRAGGRVKPFDRSVAKAFGKPERFGRDSYPRDSYSRDSYASDVQPRETMAGENLARDRAARPAIRVESAAVEASPKEAAPRAVTPEELPAVEAPQRSEAAPERSMDRPAKFKKTKKKSSHPVWELDELRAEARAQGWDVPEDDTEMLEAEVRKAEQPVRVEPVVAPKLTAKAMRPEEGSEEAPKPYQMDRKKPLADVIEMAKKPVGKAKPFAKKASDDRFGGAGKSFDRKPMDRKPYGKNPFRQPAEATAERTAERKTAATGPTRDAGVRMYSGEARPTSGKPFAKKPFEGKPYGKKPFGDKPTSDRPFGAKRAFGDKPYGKKSFSDKSFGDKPFRSKFNEDRPTGERSFGDKPFGKKPFGDRPNAKNPYGKSPYAKSPYAKKQAGSGFGTKPAKFGGKRFGGESSFGDSEPEFKPKDASWRKPEAFAQRFSAGKPVKAPIQKGGQELPSFGMRAKKKAYAR